MKISIKEVFFLIASVLLLFGGFHRLYYFHDEMFFSGGSKDLNLSYADQIDVELYLMSLRNVIDLFDGKPPNPDMEEIPEGKFFEYYESAESERPRNYLVVRLKNRGNQAAWGILEYSIEGRKVRCRVDVPPLAPQSAEFKNIVLLPDDRNIPGAYPDLRATWFKLYTKKEDKKL